MTIRNMLFLLCILPLGINSPATHAGDIISCDSFENCPDGSTPLTNALLALEARIEALEAENADLKSLLAGVSRIIDPATSQDTLRFTNMNVQIVSGTGATIAQTGTGNLIIGYNEERGSGNDRSGSHMLVVGQANSYSSYAGIVVGYNNTVGGKYSSISGGTGNTVNSWYSSVSGGLDKTATSDYCTVAGGIGTDCAQ